MVIARVAAMLAHSLSESEGLCVWFVVTFSLAPCRVLSHCREWEHHSGVPTSPICVWQKVMSLLLPNIRLASLGNGHHAAVVCVCVCVYLVNEFINPRLCRTLTLTELIVAGLKQCLHQLLKSILTQHMMYIGCMETVDLTHPAGRSRGVIFAELWIHAGEGSLRRENY